MQTSLPHLQKRTPTRNDLSPPRELLLHLRIYRSRDRRFVELYIRKIVAPSSLQCHRASSPLCTITRTIGTRNCGREDLPNILQARLNHAPIRNITQKSPGLSKVKGSAPRRLGTGQRAARNETLPVFSHPILSDQDHRSSLPRAPYFVLLPCLNHYSQLPPYSYTSCFPNSRHRERCPSNLRPQCHTGPLPHRWSWRLAKPFIIQRDLPGCIWRSGGLSMSLQQGRLQCVVVPT